MAQNFPSSNFTKIISSRNVLYSYNYCESEFFVSIFAEMINLFFKCENFPLNELKVLKVFYNCN